MAERVLGIDFGSSGLKIAEVTTAANGPAAVTRQEFMPLEPGIIANGKFEPESIPLIASDLKAFLAEKKILARDAVMGINSSSDVFVNRAETPWHEPKVYRTAVGFDILADSSLLLGAPEGVMIDAVVFGETTDEDDRRRLDVLLCGVGHKLVEAQLEVLQKAGLRVVGSDLAGLASLRATWVANRAPGVLDLLVDIGRDITSILIHEGGRPYALTLHRSTGGAALDALIAEGLQDEDPARVTREKVSFNRDYRVQKAMDEYTFRLVNTVRSAVGSYQSVRPEEAPVAGITLIGGGALVHNLPATLQEALGIRTMTGRYAVEVGGEPERHHMGSILSNDYTAAVGLAMGATV